MILTITFDIDGKHKHTFMEELPTLEKEHDEWAGMMYRLDRSIPYGLYRFLEETREIMEREEVNET